MTGLFSRLRDTIEKRARYSATVDALRHLPPHLAKDLDIATGDAERIATRAVYGR